MDYQWQIETVRPFPARGAFKSALFDFDGTLSLIREGWQQVMKPYFCEVLARTPRAESAPAIEACVHDFVDFLTGKQTIYQCIRLAEEVRARGGTPLDPQAYKEEYHRRLLMRIQHRLDGLESGALKARDMVVPGSLELLAALKARNIQIYLASGTDEAYVLNEARLLGVTPFCTAIYGAQSDYKNFSKKMVVDKIIRTHRLHGSELVGFGDGYVEIENVREAGGLAVGVASDEVSRFGVDEWKRNRLTQAGAHIIIPDYTQTDTLLQYLFPEE